MGEITDWAFEQGLLDERDIMSTELPAVVDDQSHPYSMADDMIESMQNEGQSLVPKTKSQPLTPAQARVEAVANVLSAAYAKASTLQLTPEETKALTADFQDDAFQPGAAGKENLIYIEHAYLRDRFNEVLGVGQWTIVRMRPHWGEEFTTRQGKRGTRLYAEVALIIRGCFVAEAIGNMDYYPNDQTNYGDAAKGAVTAAFRRCASDIGVGIQAWKKDFCEGWWQRRRAERAPRPAGSTIAPAKEYALKPDTQADKKPQSLSKAHDEPHEVIAQIVDVQEKHWEKDDPKTGKKMAKTAWLIKLNDSFSDIEAWCYSKSTAELASTAAGGKEAFRAVYGPASKPGSFKLISLEPHTADKPSEPPKDGEIPLEYLA